MRTMWGPSCSPASLAMEAKLRGKTAEKAGICVSMWLHGIPGPHRPPACLPQPLSQPLLARSPTQPTTHPKAAPRLLFTAAWWLASSMNLYTAVHNERGSTGRGVQYKVRQHGSSGTGSQGILAA